VTFISENIKNQLSYEPKDFVDDSNFWADNIHPEDKERVFAELPELFKQGHYSHTYRFKHKNGTYRWMHDELRLFSGDDAIPTEIVGSWLDITKRVQLEEELRKTATTDKLTKAYNRVKFEEIVAEEMERARRYNRPLSMLIFDIDKFKEVNDTYGHLVGDYALKTIADIVRSQMRKINHLVRWGGDEFVVIPVETGLEGTRVLSERIREAISSFDFDEAGKITVSIGTAQFDKADTEDDFLKRADDALYKAKEAGGNCVVVGVSRCAALHDSDFSEVLKSKNL
jgi:diguanylate cyclase (GGDEF)-like protein/PAS domain S-box-containing protein